MSKRKRTQHRRGVVDRSATIDVVTQLECAIRRPQATLIGAVIGGLVPWFARTLAHDQLPATWVAGNSILFAVIVAVVLGCACFSAITVYKFGCATFGDKRKALGFVAAIEGVMLVSTGATSAVALGVLIAINALANGATIAIARETTCKQRDAAARGAATRANKRRGAATTVQTTGPIPVEVAAAPRAKAPRPTATRPSIHWDRTMQDDIIDAEIISEQWLLA